MAEQAPDEHTWYTVTLSVPWVVRVGNPEEGDIHQDAINIAIAELDKQTNDTPTGRRDITVQTFECTDPECNHEMEAVMANAGQVMVNLSMAVNIEAESVDHAANRATRVIGEQIPDTPVEVLDVTRPEKPPEDE